MALGEGKYDDLATYVREKSNAQAVVVIVFGGEKGSGFSLQSLAGVVAPEALALVLRDVAATIEKDTGRAP